MLVKGAYAGTAPAGFMTTGRDYQLAPQRVESWGYLQGEAGAQETLVPHDTLVLLNFLVVLLQIPLLAFQFAQFTT